jgi:hypothetical protein
MNTEQKEKLQELLISYGKRYGLYRHPPYQGLGSEILTPESIKNSTGEEKKRKELGEIFLKIEEAQARSIEDYRQEFIKVLEERIESDSNSLATSQVKEIEQRELLRILEERFADLLPFSEEEEITKLKFPQNMMQSVRKELKGKLDNSLWYSDFMSKCVMRAKAELVAVKECRSDSLVSKYKAEKLEALERDKTNRLEELENIKTVDEETTKFVTTFYDICARLES